MAGSIVGAYYVLRDKNGEEVYAGPDRSEVVRIVSECTSGAHRSLDMLFARKEDGGRVTLGFYPRVKHRGEGVLYSRDFAGGCATLPFQDLHFLVGKVEKS